MIDSRENTLSARVVVVTPCHPFYCERGYLVRTDPRRQHSSRLVELVDGGVSGQVLRDWFSDMELMDEREYDRVSECL